MFISSGTPGNRRARNKARGGSGNPWGKNWQYHLMFLPGLVLLAIFNYAPMYGVVMAFQDFNPGLGFTRSSWVGLENFEFVFMLPDIGRIFVNTVVIAGSKIVLRQVTAIAFAILINEVRIRWFKRTVQTLSYLPHFLSWVILGGIFVTLLSRTGPVNQLLEVLGFSRVFFLGSNAWFRPTIILTDVWKNMGFSAIVYLAAITGINPQLYEAAVIDGAGRLRQIWHVTIPGMAPTIVLLAALSLGDILNADFEQILVLYNPAVYATGDIIDTWVYRYGLQGAQYSMAAAVGLFKSVVAFTLIVGANFLAKRIAKYQIF